MSRRGGPGTVLQERKRICVGREGSLLCVDHHSRGVGLVARTDVGGERELAGPRQQEDQVVGDGAVFRPVKQNP